MTARPGRVLVPGLVLGITVLLPILGTGCGPADLAATLEGARTAIQDGNWARAERLLDRLATSRAPRRELVALRSELSLARGDPEDAIRILLAEPETEPHAASTRLVAGQIERSRHRVGKAETLFMQALHLDPTQVLARRELLVILANQGRRAELNQQFRALSELEPLGFEDVLLWTASLEDIWTNDSVETELQSYLAADPEDRASRLALASVYLRAGRLDDAETLLKALAGDDTEGLLLRARLAMLRGDLELLDRCLAAGPSRNIEFALLRAGRAMRMRDVPGAIQEFRTARALDPSNREAIQGLASLLGQVGDRAEAEHLAKFAEQWRRLTELITEARSPRSRSDRELLKKLGSTCEQLGRQAEALGWYRLLLQLDPLDQTAQRAVYRLRPVSGSTSRPNGVRGPHESSP